MTPRSIRRAAERRAGKLARKSELLADSAGEFPFALQPSAASSANHSETAAPAIACPSTSNRQLSVVTSSLTGQVTLLAKTDAAPYTQLLGDYRDELKPVGLLESNLVEELAESVWRKRRLFALEMSIFAKGRIEFAEEFVGYNPELRDSLLDVHTFLTYEKQIHALQLQEARLARRASKAAAELATLQHERSRREAQAAPPPPQTQKGQPPQPAVAPSLPQFLEAVAAGFVFSNPETDSHPAPEQPEKTGLPLDGCLKLTFLRA